MNDEFGAVFWDERYRGFDVLWSGEPNQQLMTEVAHLRPGRALDAGCGEGGDSIWLAQRGWTVTAVDISPVALERGRAQARACGVADRIVWQEADVRTWEPPARSFDLVSAHFVHFPRPIRTQMFERLANAVASGGTLLIVAHHPTDLETAAKRWPAPEYYYTEDEVAGGLDEQSWFIQVREKRPRDIIGPEDQPVRIHDTIIRAQRRS